MKKLLLCIFFGAGLLPGLAHAQAAKAAKPAPGKAAPAKAAPAKTTPAAKPKTTAAAATPAPSAAIASAAAAGIPTDSLTGTAPVGVSLALAPATPAANSTALKVKAEVNPVTNKLSVRTDAPGPTRIEVNDDAGRPVLTKNVLVGNKPTELSVGQLPAGSYVVRCTAGEKTGMRLVRLGQ